MKKFIYVLVMASVVLLSGCASSNLSVSTPSEDDVKEFKNGVVTKTVKVLIDDRKMAILTGAGVGAVAGGTGGALAQKNIAVGALIGTVVGATVGAFVGNETEAYKTTIDNKYVAYVSKQLVNGTKVEFIYDENEIKNVNVIQDVNNDTLIDIIDNRFQKNKVWYYHLAKYNITVHSNKKYYFLDDLVVVEFDSNFTITNIEKIKRKTRSRY